MANGKQNRPCSVRVFSVWTLCAEISLGLRWDWQVLNKWEWNIADASYWVLQRHVLVTVQDKCWVCTSWGRACFLQLSWPSFIPSDPSRPPDRRSHVWVSSEAAWSIFTLTCVCSSEKAGGHICYPAHYTIRTVNCETLIISYWSAVSPNIPTWELFKMLIWSIHYNHTKMKRVANWTWGFKRTRK